GVAADDIPRIRGRAADGVVAGAALDEDAVARVAQVGVARHVGADVVAEYDVRRTAGDKDPALVVPRDDVAGRCRGPADRVTRGIAIDENAIPTVPQIHQPGDVGPDIVALDHVPRGAGLLDLDAGGEVARDDVARAGGRAADGVVGPANVDPVPQERAVG